MKALSLDGVWKITLDSTGESVEAATPVTDFNALFKSGKIQDPFYGTNEKDVQFIGETGKTFERTFTISADMCKSKDRKSVV